MPLTAICLCPSEASSTLVTSDVIGGSIAATRLAHKESMLYIYKLLSYHFSTFVRMFAISLWAATVGFITFLSPNTVSALDNGVARLPSEWYFWEVEYNISHGHRLVLGYNSEWIWSRFYLFQYSIGISVECISGKTNKKSFDYVKQLIVTIVQHQRRPHINHRTVDEIFGSSG